MMMTSTFPTSKSNSRSIKNGLKEIQVKKENLNTLEAALKKRINEFRELCLKEGELTGHLPADYPLQPREPIPQVRRRVTRSSGNIAEQFSASSTIMPPPMMAQHRLIQRPNGQVTAMTLPSTISQPPSRPTSTNSSSSASSSYRQQRAPMGVQPSLINNNYSNSSTSIMQQQQQQQQQQQKQQQLHKLTQHYQPHKQLNTHHALPNNFKTPYNLTATTTTTNPNFDIDSLGHMRASSTASSSSGSAASSTASAFASIPYNNYRLNDPSNMNSHALTSQHPVRPPRGLTHASSQSGALKPSAMLTTQLSEKQTSEGNINGLSVNGSPAARHFAVKATVEEPPKLSDLTNGVAKFQPYYEETKPFQMSDFYKYSSKHRQKGATTETGSPINDQVKTTRQLQEDVSRSKNSLRYNACDDQIQQSVNLIEKSGQKLIEATAKAIAGNPSLAERLNNILPNHHYRNGESY